MSPDLDRDLRELATRLEWPATPDLAAAVEGRLARSDTGESAPPRAARRGGRRRLPRRRLALALAALVLIPTGVAFGDDVLEWLGLASVEVERVPRIPEGAERPVVAELGEPVSLDEAEARAGFAPLVPTTLGEPQEVRLDGSVVTLVYRDGDLLVAQLPGALDEQLLTKVVGPGTEVRRTRDGLFFSGRDHVYLYRRPDGEVAEDRARLARSTFVTQRGDILVRVEAPSLTIDEARRFATFR